MEEALRWIDEDTERGQINAVREILGSKLDGVPEDICSDLQVCRFLRGHSNKPEEAAEYMSKAVDYRLSVIEKDAISNMRAAFAKATRVDPYSIPHAEIFLKFLPIRTINGQCTAGLPIAMAAPRLLDAVGFDSLDADSKAKLPEFTAGLLEMRALVLHTLSYKQKRMVKLLDIRDMTQASITYLLTEGRGIMMRLKDMISKIQDYYPEIIHQVHVFNAPPAFSKLFALLSVVLNQQMLAKIKIFPLGTPFNEFASVLDAQGVYSWITQATAGLDFSGFTVANSSVEYIARWLEEKGDVCKWSISVEKMDIKVSRFFIPANLDAAAANVAPEETIVAHDKPHEGTFETEFPGVLVLCIDNYSSWWNAKTVMLSFS